VLQKSEAAVVYHKFPAGIKISRFPDILPANIFPLLNSSVPIERPPGSKAGHAILWQFQEVPVSFLKKLFSDPGTARNFYHFSVKGDRCGEIIQVKVNTDYELSLEIDEAGISFYICRKVLIGNGHCFQQIICILKFDENRHMIDKQLTDGQFVDE